MIQCAFRHLVKVYQNQNHYLPSDTEGCAEGLFFCLQTDVLSALPPPRGAHPINFAYTHNKTPCPVTIDRMFRYKGVQIVDSIEYARIDLTFLSFIVMNGHYNSRGEITLFETEVEYRLAKWILAGMQQDGIISDSEIKNPGRE